MRPPGHQAHPAPRRAPRGAKPWSAQEGAGAGAAAHDAAPPPPAAPRRPPPPQHAARPPRRRRGQGAALSPPATQAAQPEQAGEGARCPAAAARRPTQRAPGTAPPPQRGRGSGDAPPPRRWARVGNAAAAAAAGLGGGRAGGRGGGQLMRRLTTPACRLPRVHLAAGGVCETRLDRGHILTIRCRRALLVAEFAGRQVAARRIGGQRICPAPARHAPPAKPAEMRQTARAAGTRSAGAGTTTTARLAAPPPAPRRRWPPEATRCL
jgi:hypothetical protein